MDVERINPAELARPSGFSHAVTATGGRIVFLAGQTGMDRDGKVVSGGVVAQFEQALANLLTALAAAASRATWSAPPSTSSTCRTTRPTLRRSARSGAGWPAPTTRPWRAWACPG